MIEKDFLNRHIESLLENLKNMQNPDGSFTTLFVQPHYQPDKGWHPYSGNAPHDTAVTMIPLLHLKSSTAEGILEAGCAYLRSTCVDGILWTYPALNSDYLLPYDTDSTSLCSYVLAKRGERINNKDFLDSLIGKDAHYPFYIWPEFWNRHLPWQTQIKLRLWNRRVARCRSLANDDMRISDREFGSNCVNLLYCGISQANQPVWDVVYKNFCSRATEILYYVDEFHLLYFYARLIGYEGHSRLYADRNAFELWVSSLYQELADDRFDAKLFLANALLLTEHDLGSHTALFQQCLDSAATSLPLTPMPLYSSNIKTDFQPDGKSPHTYFGSPAITCALYLEFLNWYRYRFHGSYYDECHG